MKYYLLLKAKRVESGIKGGIRENEPVLFYNASQILFRNHRTTPAWFSVWPLGIRPGNLLAGRSNNEKGVAIYTSEFSCPTGCKFDKLHLTPLEINTGEVEVNWWGGWFHYFFLQVPLYRLSNDNLYDS